MDAQLERLCAAIDRAIEGMSEGDLSRSSDSKWSASEVLEHLSLTYSGTTRGFEKCLQAGRPLATPIGLKQRLAILLVTGFGYLPDGREAPATTKPKGAPAQKIAMEFGRMIEQMDNAITACEHRYGITARLLDHPILGPLTAHQWRRFHCVHGKHHLKQIEAIRRATR